MPRLKLEVRPIDRRENSYQNERENNAWARKCWRSWGRKGKPSPCSCGYFSDGWLVTCDGEERKRCERDVAKRLKAFAKHAHEKALSEKRKFPAFERCPLGVCYWCRQPIRHGQWKNQAMHDGRKDEPNCRWEYALRTDLATQRNYLISRDGCGCKICGKLLGSFGPIWTDRTEERVAETWEDRGWIRERFAERPAGPLTYITWDTALEADHFVALAVAFEAFPDDARRRWFFGPANLRLLCPDCHSAKTTADRALLRECYDFGEAHARARVLDILSEAGLLKGRQTEEAARATDPTI